MNTPSPASAAQASQSGFVYQGGGGGGSGWVPQRGRLFKLDFPSAKFWLNIFLGGWVSKPTPPPPPRSYTQSLLPVSP